MVPSFLACSVVSFVWVACGTYSGEVEVRPRWGVCPSCYMLAVLLFPHLVILLSYCPSIGFRIILFLEDLRQLNVFSSFSLSTRLHRPH